MSTRAARSNRRFHRPGAADFFGDPEDSATTSGDSASSRKRDRGVVGGDGDLRGAKRRNLDATPKPARKYEPRAYEIKETDDLLVFGEEQNPPEDGRKRTRRLSRFTFFNACGHEMVSLDVLDDDHEAHDEQRILAAGFVVPVYDIDEDEGQEDDLDDLGEDLYVRTTTIRRHFTRYWEFDSPFFVETDHAVYELDLPNISKKYRSQSRPFWRVQTILKFVISSAGSNPEQEVSAFMRRYTEVKVFGESLEIGELWDAVPKLRRTLENIEHGDDLRASIVVHYLLFSQAPPVFKPIGKRKVEEKLASSRDDYSIEYKGNLDDAVLRTSTRTRVTPLIGQMALPFVKERLRIIGPKPGAPQPDVPRDDLALRLQGFLQRTQMRRRVQFRPEQRIGSAGWLKYIYIDDVKYEIGDTVLFYAGEDAPPNPKDIPPTDMLCNHFWFAKIISIDEIQENIHIQWFEHSSRTLLQELGHEQELFLIDDCHTLKLAQIIGKVVTHYIKPGESIALVPPHDFFYRYMWDRADGTFTNVNMDALAAAARESPDTCHVCKLDEEFDRGVEAEKIHLGIRWHGVEYHLDDCVLLKADEGTCHIGHIVRFDLDNDDVIYQAFGRTDRIGCRPETMLKDERHLFYTKERKQASFRDLIGICYVLVKEDMPELEAWLAMSPRRFYVKYRFPSLNVSSWNQRCRMRWDDLAVCRTCVNRDFMKFGGTKRFLEGEAPLRTFDPFAGTGAFGLAMEEVGCFKLTHAVEISPSAAKTLRNNASPDVNIYNQCSNLVLEHAICTHENKNPESLRSIEGHALPPPIKPGDIDCIVTGFPCQPHSTMNMYRKANDRKSNLILTVLSYVDFLRPQYCIFENVRGFLQYNLRARQQSEHKVKGGIPVGGLKLVVATLLDMGYQFRCALLQAGHYGMPQKRVRFFIIAAKRGLELPEFPQPTHDFPVEDSLEVKFPSEITLDPIMTLPGVAPHRSVSVHDAISDLPKFDWKHPKENLTRRQMEEKGVKECRADRPWCGFDGPNVEYKHNPRTTFQRECRSQPTRNIQQYTRTYDVKKVERVVSIPIRADADFRCLPPDMWEYQTSNPASAVGRKGYQAGFYGRVQDEYFQTTVANVDPTAKQCRVLHPYSKRIVTVRELARSQGFPDHFVFHAKDDRIVTMHRQIGNAVPWLVANAIAREFRETLYKTWVKANPEPEPEEKEFSDGSWENDSGDDAMEID